MRRRKVLKAIRLQQLNAAMADIKPFWEYPQEYANIAEPGRFTPAQLEEAYGQSESKIKDGDS